MQTNGICTRCGKKIRFGISLCRECRNKKGYCNAIISQNKKKLKQLLNERKMTPEWLDKFILYADNIVQCGKVLMEYKQKDNNRAFARIMKFGLACWLIYLVGIVVIQI